MIAFAALWGSGSGLVRGWQPAVRVGWGVALALVALAMPLDRVWGAAGLALTVCGWLVVCAPPWCYLRQAMLVAVALLLPLFLILLCLYTLRNDLYSALLWVSCWIVLRSLGVVMLSMSTAAVLTPSELHTALLRLGAGATLAALITQIIYNTGILADESLCIMQSWRMRGVLDVGWRLRARAVATLPLVWMLRQCERANRVGTAMTMRGFAAGEGRLGRGAVEGETEVESSGSERVCRDVVRLSGVSVCYSEGGDDVLRGVDLRVGDGERVALLGLNGSGKSTLLLAVAGVLEFRGRIECCGLELSADSGAEIRRKIGFLSGTPEDQLIFASVLQDVAFSLERLGVERGESERRATKLLDSLGVGEELLRCAPYTLSQGERQRVALAGAVVAEPELLLLDEPSTALDIAGQRELVGILSRQRSAMLIATHDLQLAQKLCTRFVVLRKGEVVADTSDIEEAIGWLSSHG